MRQLRLRILLFLSFTPIIFLAQAQQSVIPATYSIYLLANKIGTETCSATDSAHLKIYVVNEAYNDRGARRKLNAHIALDENNQPLYLSISGFTSRWSELNENIQTSKADSNSFPIIATAPATLQQALISYWQQHQSQTITALPNHQSVKIHAEGFDTIAFKENNLLLQRLLIKGLIWGNEFAWITHNGELVFISTNDTEGDKTEYINTNYETLFNTLLLLSDKYAIAEAEQEFPAIKNQYNYTAIINGILVNVNAKDSITKNALVVIHNKKIEYAGKMDTSKIPGNSYIIDAKNKYILPGLCDMHAHLMQAEWLPKYIHEGVTTVRDCGNEFEFINALQQAVNVGKVEGPQIIKAGLIDGKSSNALGAIQVASKTDAEKIVQLYKDSDFAQIKIYSSVKASLINKICDAAHNLNLTVTGHVPDGVTTTTAIDDGMDMVSHVSFFRNSMLTRGNEIDYTDKRTAKFVQLLLDKKIVLDPTLSMYGTADSSYIKNIPFYKTATYQLYKAGVPIIAGTDMSEGGIAHELELYVESGFTPLQAIKTATIVPATVMHTNNETGSIETGKQANIIILTVNPLTDIKNLKTLETVIKGDYIYTIKQQ